MLCPRLVSSLMLNEEKVGREPTECMCICDRKRGDESVYRRVGVTGQTWHKDGMLDESQKVSSLM